jgi:hypothetical protein
VSDETRTPADDLDSHPDGIARPQPAAPCGAIAAHEPMSAYGEHATFDAEPSPEPQSATVDPPRAANADETARNSQGTQYKRRKELNREDLRTCPFPRQQLKANAEGLWQVVVPNISEESGFRFVPVPKEDSAQIAEIEDFIIRVEWLASMPQKATHYFAARTRPEKGDVLVGAVVMAVPTAFSKLLGEDTKVYETLIARGAVISWAPANLNSWLNKRAIGWIEPARVRRRLG